jgi:hypothetical protein
VGEIEAATAYRAQCQGIQLVEAMALLFDSKGSKATIKGWGDRALPNPLDPPSADSAKREAAPMDDDTDELQRYLREREARINGI